MSAPLPVNILCGYLGAGKTTLLNRMLTESEQRVLVMVNDFGDINIDAALISTRATDTIQLSNGCICCSMGSGLFEAFERALSLANRVDRLLIEASGVAEPARLATFARAEPDLSCKAVVAVIDPATVSQRLNDPRIGAVLHRQIEGADIIFLSRGDIMEPAILDEAERLVGSINPVAFCARNADACFRTALDADHDGTVLAALAGSGKHDRMFARQTMLLETEPDRAGFLDCLRAHAQSVHRLKGFVRFAGEQSMTFVQLAGGNLEFTSAPASAGTRAATLVAIAPDARALERLTFALSSL